MWSKAELIEKQSQFWVLMSAGSTLQAACDAVGVNPSVHGPEELTRVAAELNSRPRKTLGGRTPAAAMQTLLSQDPVATTA